MDASHPTTFIFCQYIDSNILIAVCYRLKGGRGLTPWPTPQSEQAPWDVSLSLSSSTSPNNSSRVASWRFDIFRISWHHRLVHTFDRSDLRRNNSGTTILLPHIPPNNRTNTCQKIHRKFICRSIYVQKNASGGRIIIRKFGLNFASRNSNR